MAPRYMLIVAHLPRPYDGLGQVGQVAESVPGTGRQDQHGQVFLPRARHSTNGWVYSSPIVRAGGQLPP